MVLKVSGVKHYMFIFDVIERLSRFPFLRIKKKEYGIEGLRSETLHVYIQCDFYNIVIRGGVKRIKDHTYERHA